MRKSNPFNLLCLTAMALCLWLSPPGAMTAVARAAEPVRAFNVTEPRYGGGPTIVLGYEFDVSAPILITALEFRDVNGDGPDSSHQIGIWNAATSSLIFEGTIEAGGAHPLEGLFRVKALSTPVRLKAGRYIIGGQQNNESYAQNAGQTPGGAQVAFVQSLARNVDANFGVPLHHYPDDAGYFGPNFKYTPAPELLAQTISFDPIPAKAVTDAPFALTATASSGLPVSYSVISGPATISDSMVILTGLGEVILRASQAGDHEFAAAPPVERVFAVGTTTRMVINPDTGFTITWNGNNGDFSSADESAAPPPNIAEAKYGSASIGSSQLNFSGLHLVSHVNDGRYGNAFSWLSVNGLGGSADTDPWIGVVFGSEIPIRKVAWGRDNGNNPEGVFTDRALGVYTVQFTRLANADASTPQTGDAATGWQTIGEVSILSGEDTAAFTASLRHEFVLGATGQLIDATAIRVKVSDGNIAIDELEVYSSAQRIAFAPLAGKTLGDPSFDLSAKASSGLPVSFSVVSGPATLDGNTVTLAGAGAVVVRASQVGNGEFSAAANVEQTFTVAPAPPPAPVVAFAISGAQFVGGPTTVLGYEFVVNSPVLITEIGYLDANGDGLAASHQVGVWKPETGELVFQTTIESGSGLPLESLFRFQLLSTPLRLAAGRYVVGGQQNGESYGQKASLQNGGPEVTYIQSLARVADAGFGIPSHHFPDDAGHFGPNFKFTPAPELAAQTISFEAIAAKTTADAPFTLAASASSGLPVGFSVVSGPATISGNVVTLTGSGQVAIRAFQAGNAVFAPAAVELTFEVTPVIDAPAISVPPASQPFALNASTTLSVQAVGADLTYQWQFNGEDIPGETRSTLKLANLNLSSAGAYRVVVTNSRGSATSAPANLMFFGDLRFYAGTILAGSVGQRFRVEYANLINGVRGDWQLLEEVTLAESPVVVIDYGSPGQPQRFYQALPMP